MALVQVLPWEWECRVFGYHYDLRVHTDATAAIGIARKLGGGKIRHPDTADLWVQEKIRTSRVEQLKVTGQENPADVMTKYVAKGLMSKKLSETPETCNPTLGGNDGRRQDGTTIRI